MPETEVEETPATSPMPPLTEVDLNAPFLHETTSLTTLLLVIFALVLTCGLIVFTVLLS